MRVLAPRRKSAAKHHGKRAAGARAQQARLAARPASRGKPQRVVLGDAGVAPHLSRDGRPLPHPFVPARACPPPRLVAAPQTTAKPAMARAAYPSAKPRLRQKSVGALLALAQKGGGVGVRLRVAGLTFETLERQGASENPSALLRPPVAAGAAVLRAADRAVQISVSAAGAVGARLRPHRRTFLIRPRARDNARAAAAA